MSNNVIFAAAGNGKTYSICESAKKLAENTRKNVILVTYTNEGVASIEKEYRGQNFGVIDKNVVIKTWYSFLLSELIKPYQCLLEMKYKNGKNEIDYKVQENFIKSIAFYENEPIPRWYNSNHIQYYINNARDVRKDNVSNLALRCIETSKGKVLERLESIYSHIFFDELQDYAGWDLEIFKCLFSSKIHIHCVGDYKQATFRTNNSLKNKAYRDNNIKNFFEMLSKSKMCDISYSNSTRRFNQKICDYVNTIYNDKESEIYPHDLESHQNAENTGVFIIDNRYLKIYCEYYNPTILRYKKDSKIEFAHNCSVFNYGNSKGATFDRVVIVPVGTAEKFILKGEPIVSKQTLSKFYVACTRARYSIVFAMNNVKENEYFKATTIKLGEAVNIPAHQYSPQDINAKL